MKYLALFVSLLAAPAMTAPVQAGPENPGWEVSVYVLRV